MKVFVIDTPEKSMTFVDLVKICAAEGIHRSELAMFRAPFSDRLDPESQYTVRLGTPPRPFFW